MRVSFRVHFISALLILGFALQSFSPAASQTCGTSPAPLQLGLYTSSCGANQVQDIFEVTNNGAPVTLSDLTIKFWADNTSSSGLIGSVNYAGCLTNPSCYHQVTGASLAAASFSPSCASGANWEITFTTSDHMLMAGGVSWTGIQTAVHRADWANFAPAATAWYSPCVNGSNYLSDIHYALYLRGLLVSSSGGVPPSCRAPATCTPTSTFTKTNTPTKTPTPTPTRTPTPTFTMTPTFTLTPTPTFTPLPQVTIGPDDPRTQVTPSHALFNSDDENFAQPQIALQSAGLANGTLTTLINSQGVPIPTGNKLDPVLLALAAAPNQTILLNRMKTYGLEGSGPSAEVHVMIKTTGGLAGLDSVLDRVLAVSGNIVAGTVQIQNINQLQSNASVLDAQASVRRQLLDDPMRAAVNADKAANLLCLNGKGVVLGDVDTGIDWKHRDFQDASGNSKILALWDQNLTAQGAETSGAGGTGVVYTNSDIQSALPSNTSLVRSLDNYPVGGAGHGTHVAGILAGSGLAAGGFTGVAPGSSLCIVKLPDPNGPVGWTDDLIAAGATFIFNQAAALNEPAVVNYSLGGQVGAHDGSDYLDQLLDGLLFTGATPIPHRAICIADGDEGFFSGHAEGSIPTVNYVQIAFGLLNSATVDVWLQNGASYSSIRLVSPCGNVTPPLSIGTASSYPSGGSYNLDSCANTGSNTVLYNYFAVADNVEPQNGDQHIRVNIGYSSAVGTGFSLIIYGTSPASGGSYDAWINASGQRGSDIFLPVGGEPTAIYQITNQKRVAIPSTSKKSITVASYVTDAYASQTGDPAAVGSLSSFSCIGPERPHSGNGSYVGNAGVFKPEVTAPGEYIASALSAETSSSPLGVITSDGLHQLLQGTSMSAPVVSAVVGLMMEGNPTLTSDQLKTVLTGHTQSNAFTGALPNTSWGYGIVDAQASIQNEMPFNYAFAAQWNGSASPGGAVGPGIQGVAVLGQSVYLADFEGHRILQFDLNGNFLNSYGTTVPTVPTAGQFVFPWKLAADPAADKLYVLDQGIPGSGPSTPIIQSFDGTTWTVLPIPSGSLGGNGVLSSPDAIAADPNTGNIYIADEQTGLGSGIIERFTSAGVFLPWSTANGCLSTDSFEMAMDLTVPGKAVLYAADKPGHAKKYDLTTNPPTFLANWGTAIAGFVSVGPIAVGPDGSVYSVVGPGAVPGSGYINVYTSSGELITTLNPPPLGSSVEYHGLALDSCRNVYTSNSLPREMEKWTLCGSTCTVAPLAHGRRAASIVQQSQGTPTQTPTVTATPTETASPTQVKSLAVVAGPNISRGGQPVKFQVSLPKAAKVTLALFSTLGESVYQTTLQGSAGVNDLVWTLQNQSKESVASGLYIYLLQVDDGSQVTTKRGNVVVLH